MKNRISLDLSNMEAFKELTDIQLGELMRAVFAYASDGTMLPEDTDQAVRVAFAFLKAAWTRNATRTKDVASATKRTHASVGRSVTKAKAHIRQARPKVWQVLYCRKRPQR